MMHFKLDDLIKTDLESQESYKLYKKTLERQNARKVRTAKITVFIIALSTIMAILFLVYAFIQKTEAEAANQKILQLKEQLIECNDKQTALVRSPVEQLPANT